jgi:hypothetical protein
MNRIKAKAMHQGDSRNIPLTNATVIGFLIAVPVSIALVIGGLNNRSSAQAARPPRSPIVSGEDTHQVLVSQNITEQSQPSRTAASNATRVTLPTSLKPLNEIAPNEISYIEGGSIPVIHFFDRSSLPVDAETFKQLQSGVRFRLGYTRSSNRAP